MEIKVRSCLLYNVQAKIEFVLKWRVKTYFTTQLTIKKEVLIIYPRKYSQDIYPISEQFRNPGICCHIAMSIVTLPCQLAS